MDPTDSREEENVRNASVDQGIKQSKATPLSGKKLEGIKPGGMPDLKIKVTDKDLTFPKEAETLFSPTFNGTLSGELYAEAALGVGRKDTFSLGEWDFTKGVTKPFGDHSGEWYVQWKAGPRSACV